MSININPALIAGAQVYNGSVVATPINTCAQPAEGPKVVPLQFVAAAGVGAYLCDLSGGVNPPISQMASIFVDATQSKSDVTVIFTDTNYEFRCTAGNNQLVPVLTGRGLPKFYVVFGNNATYTPGDTANIFAVNIFIPEFGAQNFVNAIIANTPLPVTISGQPINVAITNGGIIQGLGTGNVAAPFFSHSTAKNANLPAGIVASPGFFAGNQCFLTGINITSSLSTSGGSDVSALVNLYEDAAHTNMLMSWEFLVNVNAGYGQDFITLTDSTGLNILSALTSGVGNSKFYVTLGTTADLGWVNVNLIGGTLVP